MKTYYEPGSAEWHRAREKKQGYIALILSLIITIIIYVLCDSCTTIRSYDDMSATQKSWFDACIEQHPSDAVCDSCFNAIVHKSR